MEVYPFDIGIGFAVLNDVTPSRKLRNNQENQKLLTVTPQTS